MTVLPDSGVDHTIRQAADLRRMRIIATGLLVLMFVVFVAARWAEPGLPAVSFIRAFAEAAMVGAFADWFAVVALFRRPFGLPIPHTAIIPRNKDRIGESLGRFIAGNFLDPAEVEHKLASVDVAGKVSHWLAERDNCAFLAGRIAAAVPAVADAVGDEHVKGFLREAALRSLRSIEVAPLLARVLSALVAHRHHQALFDHAIDSAGRFLIANDDLIRRKVADKSAKWVPRWVDDKMAAKILAGIEETLIEMRDPDHPWRDEFNASVERFIGEVAGSPEWREKGRAIRDEILANGVLLGYLDSLWSETRGRLMADVGREDGMLRQGLEQALVSLGTRLAEDADMRAVLNHWVLRAAMRTVVPNRGQIGGFIAGVVARWDAKTVAEKLELQVGKDLQYIRINGTLVGGLAGVAIHALGLAF